MDTYTPFHVREFQIQAIQRLVVAVHERARNESTRAEEFAREAEQRERDAEQQLRRDIQEHQDAIRDYERLQADVDAWVASRSGGDVDNLWRAMEEARAEGRESQPRTAPRYQRPRGSRNARGSSGRAP